MQAYARTEINYRNLRDKEKNFVKVMHAHFPDKPRPWIRYVEQSAAWDAEGFDCALSEIKGLSLLLRETSKNLMSNRHIKGGSGMHTGITVGDDGDSRVDHRR